MSAGNPPEALMRVDLNNSRKLETCNPERPGIGQDPVPQGLIPFPDP